MLKMRKPNGPTSTSVHHPDSVSSNFRFSPGHSLGQWKLVAAVARGTHAEIYRASPLDRGDYSLADYAVKVARHDAQPQTAKRLLQRQMLASQALATPEVIPVLSADLEHAFPHLVMPFIPGSDLQAWRNINSSQPIPVLLWLARQIAQGLQSMHQLGWVHSDLQPANILINESGHLFLTDLAFAQAIQDIDPEFGTGNPLYAAPERWHGAPELTAASDVYSLGVILFELLTGQVPVGCGTIAQYTPENMQESGQILRERNPQLPPSVERVLSRLLSRQPSRRPNCNELVPVLMALEIETFGQHINPSQPRRAA
jgi:serine/threonine-protein kinase